MASSASRVRRHDPALIESLLARREAEGIGLVRLSRESGIPFGTLSYWSWRRRQRSVTPEAGPRFAEVVVLPRVAAPRESAGVATPGLPMFEVALTNGRRVTVAAGFDDGDLRRLLTIAEATAC